MYAWRRRAFLALFTCVNASLACTSGETTTQPSGGSTVVTPITEGGTERPKKLIFGITPYLPSEQLRREFGPLVEYLGREVEFPTELRIAKDYGELIAWLERYEIHVAQLSPFNYVRAKAQNPNVVILAGQIAEGSSSYSGYIVAKEESPLNTIEDLRGKRFGYVDKQSTSGYLYPLAYLRGMGIDPKNFFGEIQFSGNHARLVELVLGGQVDAGATFSTSYKIASMDRPDQRLKIIAKTGRIPYDVFAASPRLDGKLVEQLRTALLSLSTRDDEGRRVLAGFTNINGFVTVGDDHYDEVRRVARIVEEIDSLPPVAVP